MKPALVLALLVCTSVSARADLIVPGHPRHPHPHRPRPTPTTTPSPTATPRRVSDGSPDDPEAPYPLAGGIALSLVAGLGGLILLRQKRT